MLTVSDTGAGADHDDLRRGRMRGVGLQNVERRLACHYGDAASLTIDSGVDTGTTVEIRVPLDRTAVVDSHAELNGVARR